MAQVHIERSKEPIRLLRSDLLEAFTHVHPALVPCRPCICSWPPTHPGEDSPHAPRGRASQSACWRPSWGSCYGRCPSTCCIASYSTSGRAHPPERVAFLMHGVQHAQPQVKSRLVMPPAVSVPLAAAFYGLFSLVFGTLLGAPHWTGLAYGGLLVGYVIYDLTHYAVHHAKRRGPYLRYVRSHDLRHHGQAPNQRFVTSHPWDLVFGTEPSGPA